jgi:hypothetical protein
MEMMAVWPNIGGGYFSIPLRLNDIFSLIYKYYDLYQIIKK